MGHDVITICNHKLNTASLRAAAEDLNHRYYVPVAYGHYDDWMNLKTGEEGSYEFVEEGRVGAPGGESKKLVDTLYTDRHYYKMSRENELLFRLHGPSEADFEIDIFSNTAQLWIHFDSRWRNFVRYYQGLFNDDEGWHRYMQEHRRKVYTEMGRIGGTVAIYGDDQGPTSFISEMPVDHSFEAVKQKVLDEFGNAVLDVASFYRNGCPVSSINWLAFIDDFSDLVQT